MLLLPFGELFSYLFDDRVSNVNRDAETSMAQQKSCQPKTGSSGYIQQV